VSWLYRSVRFTCLDELRRRKRHPETPTDDLPEVATSAPDEPFDTELVEALATLTERQRTIIVLRYVLDASVGDIAGILGTNRAAVYAASSRAERRLARELENVEQSRLATSSSMREPRRDGP
jgi:RNA polymerase sigma factor (sigma-70 family)